MGVPPMRDPENPPRVSVVLPVRNGEPFIGEALQSMLNQTWHDFEIVVIDDNSSDATPDILHTAAQMDKRIRILHLDTPTGIVGALNHGLEAARGEYIARMDADDVSLPNRMTLEVEFLDRHAEVAAASGHVLYMDRDGDPLGCPEMPNNHEEIDGRHMTGVGGGICHSAAILRRNTVLAVGGYRPEFSAAEDLDLFLRLAEVSRLANIPDTIQKVRFYPTSHSLRSRDQQRKQCHEALRQAHQRRGLPFDPEVFRFPPQTEDNFGSLEFFARFAIDHGYPRTALKHAIRQLLTAPLRSSSWRTVAASIISVVTSSSRVRSSRHQKTSETILASFDEKKHRANSVEENHRK